MSSFNDSRGYQENTTQGKGGDIGRLIRENAPDAQVLYHLRQKHPNDADLVGRLFAEYEEKMSRIRRKAQKFATLIITKYSHLGPKRIMEKAKKYKKKYDFSDDEFAAFINVALSDKAFSTFGAQIPNTAISRTLGHTAEIPVKMQVKSQELDVLQEILKMHSDNTALHAQVIIQSLTYAGDDECKVLVAKSAKDMYDPKKDNMYTNVHPVIFALFAPKIKDIEERMLLASISGIVSARYNGTQFKSHPDWLLYHDLIQDPNEITCASSKETPLVDLRNRVRVQVELWRSVRDVRQGRFYNESNVNFLAALKACKNPYYDSPDFSYIEDEGSVLRRLLSVFAYRPTVVSVRALNAAHGFSIAAPVTIQAMTQVVTVPIINIRLPSVTSGQVAATSLATSLTQPDYYVENKVIVPKTKEVIFTRGVIFFYINRRSFGFDYAKLVTHAQPTYANVLPFSISGYEKVNDAPVTYNADINIGGERYAWKSAVLIKTKTVNTGQLAGTDQARNLQFITGSTAVVSCGTGGNADRAGIFPPGVQPNPYISTEGFSSWGHLGRGLITYDPLNEIADSGVVAPLSTNVDAEMGQKVTVLVFTKQAGDAPVAQQAPQSIFNLPAMFQQQQAAQPAQPPAAQPAAAAAAAAAAAPPAGGRA